MVTTDVRESPLWPQIAADAEAAWFSQGSVVETVAERCREEDISSADIEAYQLAAIELIAQLRRRPRLTTGRRR